MSDRYNRGDDRGRDSGGDRGGRDRGNDRARDSGRDSGRDAGRGRAGGSRYTYQPRTQEAVQKRATSSSDFDKIINSRIKMWTAKKGDNRIRILPPTWKIEDERDRHYGYDAWVHYGVGPDRAAYLDLYKMKGQPDPITDEVQALRKSGDATDEDIKEMDSKKRVVVYMIDRDDEQEGVQVWAMPPTVDRDLNVLCKDKSTGELINIDDPEEGYDVEFRRDGEGLKTKYGAISIARRPSRLGKDEWLDFAVDNPIPDQLQYYTYDEIAKVFGGGGVHRESRDSRDERPERDDRGNRRDGGREDSDRGDDRGRDRADTRDSRRDEPPTLTWEIVHDMTSAELDALVADMPELKECDPNKAESDAQLADWICEDLKLTKAVTARRSSSPPAGETTDRLARMREDRNRR